MTVITKMAKILALLAALVTLSFGFPRIDISRSWRVIGGAPAPEGEYPHQISLKKSGSHYCGGSIVNEEWIVTAAHCVAGKVKNWTVVVGTNRLNSGGVELEVERVVFNLDYDPWIIINDIGLIKVKGRIRFDERVQPIPLETQEVGGGEDCVLSGWGKTNISTSMPNDLHHITLKTISLEDCQTAHPLLVIESEICTLTKEGEGACNGDSGGALTRTVDNVRRLIGIVSWGKPCAKGAPDVFTKVSSFLDWIAEHCDSCATTI